MLFVLFERMVRMPHPNDVSCDLRYNPNELFPIPEHVKLIDDNLSPILHCATLYDSKSTYPEAMNNEFTPPRYVMYYEINIYDKDGGIIEINNEQYPIKKGCAVFARPGDIRRHTLPMSCYAIRFKLYDYRGEIQPLCENHYISNIISYMPLDNYEICLNTAKFIIDSDSAIMRKSKIIELLYRLYVNSQSSKNASAECDFLSGSKPELLASKLCGYINEHYSEQLTLDSLGKAFHYTPLYIQRVFTRVNGMTPHKYILKKRIARACELLGDEKYKVDDIAQFCGFSSTSHFSKAFLRETGKLPSEYRSALRRGEIL